MKKILLFVPTITGSINNEVVKSLVALNTDGLSIAMSTTTRTLIHSARNAALNEMIIGGFDYLFFIDDDNWSTDVNLLHNLINVNKDIVCGAYQLRGKHGLSIGYSKPTESGILKYESATAIDRDGIFKIDVCGFGCVLLSRNIVEDMLKNYKMPFECKNVEYFSTEEQQKTGMSWAEFNIKNRFSIKHKEDCLFGSREMSEDYIFCERARQIGYDIYCDGKARINHIGIPNILIPH